MGTVIVEKVERKEPIRRFVGQDGIVEYSEEQLEAMRQESISEKEFDSLRYAGHCPAGCRCGKGNCPII